MSANKINFSRIFILPFLVLAIIIPAHGMQTRLWNLPQPFEGWIKKQNRSLCSVLNGLTRNSLEIVSKATQDKLYGSQDNDKVAEPIIDLIKEVIKEMGGFPEVKVKKMSKDKVSPTKDVPYTIAEEYGFIGIAPTNTTLYIDEDYFKENILNKEKETQKLIIRTALKHYLNGTYSIVRSSRFAIGSLAATGAAAISKYALGTLGNWAQSACCSYFGSSEHATPDLGWNPTEICKKLGIFAAKTVIGGFVFAKAYQKMYGTMDKPTQHYLDYKTNQFDTESIKGKSDSERKDLAKDMIRLISESDEYKAQDDVLESRVKNLFDKKTLEDAEKEVDLPINNIMSTITNEFNQLKKQKNQGAVMQFMCKIGGIAAQFPREIQVKLQRHINKFIENEVLPFYNSLIHQ